MNKKLGFRKLVNTLHLWVGVPSALILFIICLSGTVYVFNKEITKWVDSDKFYVKTVGTALPAEQLVAMVENEKKGMRVAAITIPANADEAWMFAVGENKKKEKKQESLSKTNKPPKKEREKITTYLVDPYTGNFQGNAQTTTSEFFNTVMQLHRWLLMDHDIGTVITGVASFMFLFLEITGLILWLPGKFRTWKRWNAWKSGFTVKTSANWKRINHDLHKSIGFYTFLIITVLALTGPVLAFEWYKKAFNSALGAKPTQRGGMQLQSIQPADSLLKPLVVSQWIIKANSLYSYNGDLRITLPKTKSDVITVLKTPAGFAGADKLSLDQYSNKIIKDEPFAEKTVGEKISSTVKAIHTGEIFGMVSKIIYFIACLLATSLPVTGIFIWLNKSVRKKRVWAESVVRPPA